MSRMPDREEAASRDHVDRAVEVDRSGPWSPTDRHTLPRSERRQVVDLKSARYAIRQSEAEILAALGTFRVIAQRDLATDRDDGRTDIQSLRIQGLVESRSVVIEDAVEPVLTLTESGRQLLETHRARSWEGPDSLARPVYAGFSQARELAHDAQLFGMFLAERDQIEADGGFITQVTTDPDFKRDYHQTVEHRIREGFSRDQARREYAEVHNLPFPDGHIEIPDIRIEYQSADGQLHQRDLELATNNYSHSQLAAKHAAGFRIYRGGGSRARAGTIPLAPRRRFPL